MPSKSLRTRPTRKTRASAKTPPRPQRIVTPDKLDLRDRPYQPSVAIVPPPRFRSRVKMPVLSQGDSSACTGFALATVVGQLLKQSNRTTDAAVSPWMLYSMARR